MSPDFNEFDRNGDCGKEVKILFKSSKFKVTDVQKKMNYECRWRVLRSRNRWFHRWGRCHRPAWNLSDSWPSTWSRHWRRAAAVSNWCSLPCHLARYERTFVPLRLDRPEDSVSCSACIPCQQRPALVVFYTWVVSLISNRTINPTISQLKHL